MRGPLKVHKALILVLQAGPIGRGTSGPAGQVRVLDDKRFQDVGPEAGEEHARHVDMDLSQKLCYAGGWFGSG